MSCPEPGNILGFEATSLAGDPIRFSELAGKVVLIVNTASQCGFTPQYAGLQRLHETYGERGLVVVGFPCNQFGAQEPGGEDEISRFCEINFGVSFFLTQKVEVNGANAHPLFKFLTAALPGVLGTQPVKWNFTKFLVNKAGVPVKRYASMTPPADLAEDIEGLL